MRHALVLLSSLVFLGGATDVRSGEVVDESLSVSQSSPSYMNRVFFSASDNTSAGLWVSGESAASLYEIGGAAGGVVGNKGAFFTRNIARLKTGVLFQGGGNSPSGTCNDGKLWFSNGSAVGTKEIGGLCNKGVKDASAIGIRPFGMVPFGQKVLFQGHRSPNDKCTVFATDGTGDGTVIIDKATNVYYNGLTDGCNYGISGASIGNKYIFLGLDATHYMGLWVTDGTIAGTREIGGLKNGGVVGVPATNGLNARSLTRVGSKVFFVASDAKNSQNTHLWVTDGTTAGTKEIGGFSNAGISNFYGIIWDHLYALNGKLIFSGQDRSSETGVWVSDGTAKGTIELGGLGSAGLNGGKSFYIGLLQEFTASGNLGFFSGIDPKTSSGFALWKTDGTTSGTKIVRKMGPNSSNYLNPAKFTTVGNGKVFFEGQDASGAATLWTTDGTLVNTFEIGGLNNHLIAGASSAGL